MKLKLVKIGNDVGLILPNEALARMKLGSGDAVYLTETPDGYQITPYDPEFGRQMELARRAMKERRAALRELAE